VTGSSDVPQGLADGAQQFWIASPRDRAGFDAPAVRDRRAPGRVHRAPRQIGDRDGTEARAGEVLLSETVKALTAGSGLTFEDTGEHELKGAPDRWRLYRAVA